MPKLKRSQVRLIEETVAWPQGFGYVLDFSDRTMAEFFEDEFGIEIYQEMYSYNGSSKRNYLKAFIETENEFTVASVLRAIWERRETLVRRKGSQLDPVEEQQTKEDFLKLIADVEGQADTPSTKALERFVSERTLDELINDIERDLLANKPEAVMDRLHTYCMKKIRHLLQVRGEVCGQEEALHSIFGRYRKILEQERNLTEFSKRALKVGISLFDGYNDIRNNHSFAHPNPILDTSEARYVFETISALLLFIRAVEAGRYDQSE